jgi:hypothetical protein
MMSEKTPARRSVSPFRAMPSGDFASQRQPVRAQPAAIQPIVPQTRMAPNSFSEFCRLTKAIEFVRASVGA